MKSNTPPFFFKTFPYTKTRFAKYGSSKSYTAFHQNNWSDQSEVHFPGWLYYNITAAFTEPCELAS